MMKCCKIDLQIAVILLSLALLPGSPAMSGESVIAESAQAPAARDKASEPAAKGLSRYLSERYQYGNPISEQCTLALQVGRDKVSKASPKSLSRYFAERLLRQAEVEAGNREYDDCLEFVVKAIDEIDNRRHWLAPGETFRATTSTGIIELRGEDE